MPLLTSLALRATPRAPRHAPLAKQESYYQRKQRWNIFVWPELYIATRKCADCWRRDSASTFLSRHASAEKRPVIQQDQTALQKRHDRRGAVHRQLVGDESATAAAAQDLGALLQREHRRVRRRKETASPKPSGLARGLQTRHEAFSPWARFALRPPHTHPAACPLALRP